MKNTYHRNDGALGRQLGILEDLSDEPMDSLEAGRKIRILVG